MVAEIAKGIYWVGVVDWALRHFHGHELSTHRGSTTAEPSVWRRTLDHLDAIKIGLTATPAAHTKAYFRDIVYRYEYERAVRDGHLVDYYVATIKSDVRMKGVFLREGEHVGVVDPETGSEQMALLEDEREFDTSGWSSYTHEGSEPIGSC